MKKINVFSLTVFLFVYFAFSFGFSQALKVAFVDQARLFAAHPSGEAAAQLNQDRLEELAPLIEEARALSQKQAVGLSEEEQERFDVLVRTIQFTQQRYDQEIQFEAGPAFDDINRAIQAVAQGYGYQLILDGTVLEFSVPVILYIQGVETSEGIPDATEQVIVQMQSQQ